MVSLPYSLRQYIFKLIFSFGLLLDLKIWGANCRHIVDGWSPIFFIKFFYTTMNIHCIMSKLTIETLGKICDKLPGEYIVEFVSNDGVTYQLSDTVEVDVSAGKLILKS